MIRLLVVDDQDIFRQDLAILLSAEADLDVVGQASHGREAIALRWLLHSSTPMTTFLV
jgi:DNA-binding NarL/FixJ family response regulator